MDNNCSTTQAQAQAHTMQTDYQDTNDQKNWDTLLVLRFNGRVITPLSKALEPEGYNKILRKLAGQSLEKAQQVIDDIFKDPDVIFTLYMKYFDKLEEEVKHADLETVNRRMDELSRIKL